MIELIKFTQAANVLTDEVGTRGMELVEDLPDAEPPSARVLERARELSEPTVFSDLDPESLW